MQTAETAPEDREDDALAERILDLLGVYMTPGAMRIVRGLVMWGLASALLYASPVQQPRCVLYGLAIGIMSTMNVTKYLAGLAVFLLLAIDLGAPYLRTFV